MNLWQKTIESIVRIVWTEDIMLKVERRVFNFGYRNITILRYQKFYIVLQNKIPAELTTGIKMSIRMTVFKN